MKIAVVVKRTHAYINTLTHLDVNECAANNGGCDSKRTCTNTVGSMSCGDCPAGYANDGAKGCKGVCVCVCVCAFMSVNRCMGRVRLMNDSFVF